MSCGSENTRQFLKDPDDVLDYKENWSATDSAEGAWLIEGDTIDTSTWVISTITDDPTPLEVGPLGESHTDTTATIWLAGGWLGKSYKVTNRITTVQGRAKDKTLTFNIQAD